MTSGYRCFLVKVVGLWFALSRLDGDLAGEGGVYSGMMFQEVMAEIWPTTTVDVSAQMLVA